MTGRAVFKYLNKLINLMVFFLKILPRGLRIFIWDLVSPFSQLPFIGLRYILLKSMLLECGNNVRVGKNVTINGWKNLTIGNNVSIHDNCYIEANGGISIRDSVSIAHSTSLLSSNHSWSDASIPIKYNPIIFRGLLIEDDVWIGCGCRILAGVTIGRRSIVAAGAVVNNNVDENCIVGGVPAKIIKKI